ncbi:uncharacterized protein CANTADRAFT_65315 [Suhomyces tanzawaensis NRRL Y-17324]|uniref:tRNA-splicing endonuclease subunit Sen15 domain-containing protein n=1 Tax=Suhomyces tanzawaensis NRRL Y-17324 TaxID=984487 RepID=A0A1E4SLU8_9ASCO|nr:uncharacterized protein CANTADRAFT_65315 [Suhomyces tanzawaensis NRRL Y-17324]ODV80377.1 hypothetical protein CANTADRAFT_65315 [Suhomyces tanzawaensis NRRL Y-17324]
MSSLAHQVLVNLVHYNNWTSVESHTLLLELTILCGVPPATQTPDSLGLEWVIPRSIKQDPNISAHEINGWFQQITQLSSSKRPTRITIAIVNDDGTIVYYFIHDGVVKPRQN